MLIWDFGGAAVGASVSRSADFYDGVCIICQSLLVLDIADRRHAVGIV